MNINKWIVYTIAGFFIASCFFCIFALAYRSIESVSGKGLEGKITQCKEEVVNLSKEQAYLKEWQNIGTYFRQFNNKYLMKMDDFSRFRDELAMMFGKYGLGYKRIQYKYKSIFNDYIRVEVVFTVNGFYPGIKRLINELLNLDKMILIERVQLNRSKEKGDISGKFTMEVYLVK